MIFLILIHVQSCKFMILTIDLPKKLLLSDNSAIMIRVKEDGSQELVVGEEKTLKCEVESKNEPACDAYFIQFIEHLIEELQDLGKERTSETYACTARSFRRYMNDKDVKICDIDHRLIDRYEVYLKKEGLTLNTISFYMRVMRATYHKALEYYGLPNNKPFVNVFTGSEKTIKRATTLRNIQRISQVRLLTKNEAFARDIFMFSYYTRGMAFVDIAHLKKSDIKNGYLTYKRQKTGQMLKIAWKQDMQDIVNRHPSLDGVHLLGLLDENSEETLRHQYHIRQCLVNVSLKKIATKLKLRLNLTMYVARHSWATIAKQMNIPLNVISDSMGHNSEKTTQIYLKSVDAEVIDRSNDLLIKAVECGRKKK